MFDRSSSTARGVFWTSCAFYILIAFEFFYMASPFAAYFYAVYGPGFDGLQQYNMSGWMLWFFLPHIVADTRSQLINSASFTGAVLFFGGLFSFAVGAYQVYSAKLKKTGAVTGGMYRLVRHPQYTALMVTSLGMLLIWPRFLVLFSTIALMFAYITLARVEERLCLKKFPDYADFQSRTSMFLPFRFASWRLPNLKGRLSRLFAWIAAMIIVTAIATASAFVLRTIAIDSLYTFDVDGGVYLSITAITDEELAQIERIASSQHDIIDSLKVISDTEKFLAYIVPAEMFISEVPMVLPEGSTFGHTVPAERDPHRYKVIFTKASFTAVGLPEGGSILAHAVNKYPLIEVHINLNSNSVEAVYSPPADTFYPDVQVPVF